MSGFVTGGILRLAKRIASTVTSAWRGAAATAMNGCRVIALVALVAPSDARSQSEYPPSGVTELDSVGWDFGRDSDLNFDDSPDLWQRYEGVGYPRYVRMTMPSKNADLEKSLLALDRQVVNVWSRTRQQLSTAVGRFESDWPRLAESINARGYLQMVPMLPPSICDAVVDRFLRVDLDGGQFKIQSPPIPASRMYQYRFSCQFMTQGLHHDRARAEMVFLDDLGNELSVHSTLGHGGSLKWTQAAVENVRPPLGTTAMLVRLMIDRSEDGLEDINGMVGFDNVVIQKYPQLNVTTDVPTGVYRAGEPIITRARIMGLPVGASEIQFRLLDQDDRELASKVMSITHRQTESAAERDSGAAGGVAGAAAGAAGLSDASRQTVARPEVSRPEVSRPDEEPEVSWALTPPEPGFYRVSASILGKRSSTLSTEVTFAVIDDLVGGPPHGPFGWTLPEGDDGIPARDLAPLLADLGVAWVKFPCWLEPDNTIAAEETAATLAKMQDAGMQTVGMLDVPPESEVPKYDLRGRRDLVASQLLRDVAVWQPLLEPVMSRLTLRVRTWQLGADRDHSFLGRPRLRDSVTQIATGLQGFGQPIDVAISWPWLEEELAVGEASWQAVSRSSDPPLAAHELDQFLSLSEKRSRGEGPRTWLILDPIAKSQYDRQSRIRDLVLRMATVRGHRVQAAFISNPRDEQNGLLRPDGRPGELLLPWRTTSRLIGNLRRGGSLQLPSGAQNTVFVGTDRSVLMLWSSEPIEERIYLGENVQMVDVWGKVTDLPVQPDPVQPAQHVAIGPVPIFIVGADPSLLAFRMSVEVEPPQLDSLLGRVQSLRVKFANPTRDSLVGSVRVMAPPTWSIDEPLRDWESVAGRSVSESFDVVLSNIAKVGRYDLTLQFELDTIPPKLISVHRNIDVGPDGLELKVSTRLLPGQDLRVQIEMTNHSGQTQSYDCLLFPPPGRQYQRRFVTIGPEETIRREIFWPNGGDLVGKKMLLRAEEQDGNRVLNYSIDVRR